MQQLLQFLKTLTGPAWLCCLVAVTGLLFSLYAWLPLHSHPAQFSRYLAVAAMASVLIAFMSTVGHYVVAWECRKSSQPKVRLPRVYWTVATASLGYFLVVFLGVYMVYPHGVALGPSVDLRVASAVTLFFGVSALGFTQWAGLRVLALRSAP